MSSFHFFCGDRQTDRQTDKQTHSQRQTKAISPSQSISDVQHETRRHDDDDGHFNVDSELYPRARTHTVTMSVQCVL